jgi:acyl-coenzyme A synthetase/AMP-(fatty) acid ligase
VKSVIFGQRRGSRGSRTSADSLDAALLPALAAGNWDVPKGFNFTRDVVQQLAKEPKRQALTFVGNDGVIEHWTFFLLAQGAARWATLLRKRGVGPGDRVLVVEAATPDWVQVMLAGLKIGAVTVPCSPALSSSALDIRIVSSGAKLVVATRRAQSALICTAHETSVLYVDEARRHAHRLPRGARTHDTSARDAAFIVSTSGRTNGPRCVVHTHGSTYAARVHTEHWLDAGRGDVVWCTARTDTAQALWSTLLGPWSRGAEIVLHDGPIDPVEQLEVLRRVRVTVLCQTPEEYRALAETGQLSRFRRVRPRRLVSTGASLPADLIGIFEDEWGLTIHDGYGQAETGIVIGHDVATGHRAGSIGHPLPGYEVAVIDPNGNELAPGFEGDLALRGHPPSLFLGYWNAPEATRDAFRGDWYVTGDRAVSDKDGFLWLRGRDGSDPAALERQAAFPPVLLAT